MARPWEYGTYNSRDPYILCWLITDSLEESEHPVGGPFGPFSGVPNPVFFGDFHISCGWLRRIRG